MTRNDTSQVCVETTPAVSRKDHSQFVVGQFNVAPSYKAINDVSIGHLSKDACFGDLKTGKMQ